MRAIFKPPPDSIITGPRELIICISLVISPKYSVWPGKLNPDLYSISLEIGLVTKPSALPFAHISTASLIDSNMLAVCIWFGCPFSVLCPSIGIKGRLS